MLHKQMGKYISTELMNNPSKKKIELYQEEKEYIEKYELIPDDITFIEKDPTTRFLEAYIERCDKETEEMLSKESFRFLENSIVYLQKHKNEFLYFESQWFEKIGVDGISFEVNDVFGTYFVMVGLKLPKKNGPSLKENLTKELDGDVAKYELMFNQNDGLWDLNFALNYVNGFNEQMSLEEAFRLIYRFLFNLVESVEERSKNVN
ncbi:branched-chain amino acid aminotransferase [Bacillus sinesaloumensis]|uniref:branched-chain amino acid aminotransferase n=1 Tax=Litchfieldia sinesaloumensis TaxID=1926280 RepID=UPI0009883E7C|nr:branched-chain amino acid aminotransferase [Bacillus sinesaloumensis]